MIIFNQRITTRLLAVSLSVAMLAAMVPAQTKITPPNNKYKPSEDVEIGRKGAQQVRQEMPVFPQNDEIDNYVESVGRRLIRAIPSEYYFKEFEYSFDVVNARDINAFALPGGPMFVNRGMIEAAKTEGEMAGVMAHEISHVALRHGTAQASKAQSPGVLAGVIGGAVLGSIIGGNIGSIIAQGAQIGASAYILKYSREYETQADILGAQIMARAGYDPRDLANMFKTIEQQSGGGGGPEWLSSHPNPGNRYERINEEARSLSISRVRNDEREFARIQSRLRSMSQAPTMAEIAKNQPASGGGQPSGGSSGGTIESRVEDPSNRYRRVSASNLFELQIPDNWQEYSGQNSVTYAPRGGHGSYQGQTITTHGTLIGLTQGQGNDLRRSSDALIEGILQGNPHLRSRSNYRRVRIDGRTGYGRAFSGRSPTTGQVETVVIYTTLTRSGELLYIINVAPESDYRDYERAFGNIVSSLRIAR